MLFVWSKGTGAHRVSLVRLMHHQDMGNPNTGMVKKEIEEYREADVFSADPHTCGASGSSR